MSTLFNFSAAREQAEKAFGLSKGEYLKVKDGPNRIRLLSECAGHESIYNGKKNFKWVCWVIDRTDGVVKPYFMPMKVYRQIEALQFDPDYAFESVPMPYDITINVTNAGEMNATYTITPARQNTPITEAEMEELKSRLSITEFVAKLKEKAGETEEEKPLTGYEKAKATAKKFEPAQSEPIEENINVEDIPF
jgi:hypothetical protein